MKSKNSIPPHKIILAIAAFAVIAGAYYFSSKYPETKGTTGTTGTIDASTSASASARVADATAPNAIVSADAALGDASASDASDVADALDLSDASEYDRLMALGTELIKSKKYPEAIEKLTLALKGQPNDARALAERGTAKFMSGDFRDGNVDLANALTKTTDPKTLADIWFKRGLLDEKLLGEQATSAFAASFALSPSKEAEDKVGSHTICPPDVERRELTVKVGDAGDDDILRSDLNIVTLFPALPGWYSQHEALPKTGAPAEANIWTAVTDSATAPPLPTVVQLTDYTTAVSYLIFRARSRVWALQLARLFKAWNGMGDAQFTVSSAGPRIHVHGYWAQALEQVVEVQGDKAHSSIEGALVEVDAIVDLAKNRILVVHRGKPGRFVERATTPSAKGTLTPEGIRLEGLGCNDTFPLVERTTARDASTRD